jgi:probable HAF family extracellular repeat protein
VVGEYYFNNQYRGFELVGTTYTSITPIKSFTTVNGISQAGKAVGYSQSKSTGQYSNFSYLNGTFTTLNIKGATDAEVYGISPTGNILVGIYFANDLTLGFVYQNQTVQTLQFPGAIGTYPAGINEAGTVVGTFTYGDGNLHGFTWAP